MIKLYEIKAGDVLKWEEEENYEYYLIISIEYNNFCYFKTIKSNLIFGDLNELHHGNICIFNSCTNLGNNPFIEEE